jgi:hypothetical protein
MTHDTRHDATHDRGHMTGGTGQGTRDTRHRMLDRCGACVGVVVALGRIGGGGGGWGGGGPQKQSTPLSGLGGALMYLTWLSWVQGWPRWQPGCSLPRPGDTMPPLRWEVGGGRACRVRE